MADFLSRHVTQAGVHDTWVATVQVKSTPFWMPVDVHSFDCVFQYTFLHFVRFMLRTILLHNKKPPLSKCNTNQMAAVCVCCAVNETYLLHNGKRVLNSICIDVIGNDKCFINFLQNVKIFGRGVIFYVYQSHVFFVDDLHPLFVYSFVCSFLVH